ncbi:MULTISPECIES: methyltransferase [unclassified Leifsonia]|uniref:DUF7059 domain-containing protein n=1 Tax=unclassified Leifsonia TaxID=2663824 RepID=UPI000B7F96E5|nr:MULTISPECIES: methyltransferase [unclassified Leifsonia]
MTDSAPPAADRIPDLRSDLLAAGLSVDALMRLWGEEAAEALHRGQRVPAERALARREPSALATLARLFVLGLPVAADAAAAALPALGVEGAVALGLVTLDDASGTISAAVDLRPYAFVDAAGPAEWWIVSDLGELVLGGPLPEDHVLGVGGASLTLSGLMLQDPVESVLDLGTGCGIQAMHAARHARRVVATDISPRALRLAALNLALNEIDGVELRLGSMFEPVAGERFDHIVSNPPFVITPRVEGVPAYEYRDGGMVGDGLVASFVSGCGTHLAPGGVAQLLGNWEYRCAGDGLARVREWVDASIVPLDAWVIERDVEDAVRYAETWIRDGGTRPGTPAFDRLLGAWLEDFEGRDVRSVGFGYLLLRRVDAVPGRDADSGPDRAPDGGPAGWMDAVPTLRRFERLHGPVGANEAGLGVHLGEALVAHDLQAALDDDALARLRPVLAGDVTEERHLWPGADSPTAILLRQGGAFGRVVSAGTGLAALVGACDGELSVGAIVAALAQLLEVDEDALRSELLPAVRGLLVDGFLRA